MFASGQEAQLFRRLEVAVEIWDAGIGVRLSLLLSCGVGERVVFGGCCSTGFGPG